MDLIFFQCGEMRLKVNKSTN